jgi:DNA-binding SARP family transcriptional activator/Tfp pilus assembly protein PilF
MRFQVLGAVEVWNSGGRVRITGMTQAKALAVLLAEANHMVPLHRLVDALWDDCPPATAKRQVQNSIAALRRTLADNGNDPIERIGDGYRLATTELDWLEFRHEVALAQDYLSLGQPSDAEQSLVRALGLWQGSALGSLTGRVIESVAHRMNEARWSATEDLIDVELGLGRHGRAIERAHSLLTDFPSRQKTTGQLMLALHLAGRKNEALEVYADLRARLADELGLGPDDALQLLHSQILRDEAPNPAADAVASVPKALPKNCGTTARQLPAGAPHFTGRASQLAELDKLLSECDDAPDQAGAARIVAVTGTAGVGKTALAVHWSHRIVDRFPDGQLYVNLRGFDPGHQPVSPTAAVRTLLGALGARSSDVPAELDGQTGLYRSLLADKRVLVVLDNARDVDQVRLLLPGTSGSLAVITSRNRLSGLIAQGAHPVALNLLSADEAGGLLTRRLGDDRIAAEPNAVERIIDACAGLPLALSIVAARATTQPGFPLSALASQLRDANARLDALADPDPATDVRTVFSWSYNALNAETARLFRLLSLHPGPEITPAAAAALTGTSPRRASRLLAELAGAVLLVEQAPGRYAFHDLLRAYAGELAGTNDSQPDRDRAVHRVLDYYLHTAYAADRLIDPTRDPITLAPVSPNIKLDHLADDEAAMAWFASEHAVLLAAVEYALERGLETHCWHLAWSLMNYLHRRGRWHDMAVIWETALEATRRADDVLAQSRGLRYLAHTHTRLGRFVVAHTLLDEALILCQQLDDKVGEAHTHNVRGRIHKHQEDFAEALACNRRALALYEATDHRGGQSSALNSIGWFLALLGDHRQALHYCERALALMEEIDDRSGKAAVWNSLGYIHHHLGHHDRAIAHYERSLDLFRELDFRSEEATTLTGLGDTHRALGDIRAARHAWRQALTILDEFDHPDADKVRTKLGHLDQ